MNYILGKMKFLKFILCILTIYNPIFYIGIFIFLKTPFAYSRDNWTKIFNIIREINSFDKGWFKARMGRKKMR